MAEFIAEISSNHNGDLERCRMMIRAAADCGCTGVKFQLFRIEQLFAPEILQVSPMHRERRRWELPPRFLPELARACREAGVRFGCTPFDLEAVDLLAPHVDFLKVASYELPWLDLIRRCAGTGLPLMISTGMADADEIAAGLDTALAAGCADLTVFHCVSSYPAPAAACNLAAIAAIGELAAARHPAARVRRGWSDHSVSPGVVRRAVDRWKAEVVEFHFDLEGRGEEFGGGHCWLPETITPVIGDGGEPGDPAADGDGRLGATPAEEAEREWRADPDDGLRPWPSLRESWPAAQPGARPAGPRCRFLPDGVGLGHLARCLALAEALRRDHDADCLFFLRPAADAVRMLARHGFTWLPADDAPGDDDGAIWILDLDHPADERASELAARGRRVVVLDQTQVTDADLVLVPAVGWRTTPDDPQAVGGTDYLLVREDVARLRDQPRDAAQREGIVISFGGCDPNRLTERVAAAVSELPFEPPVSAILGPGFADRQAREEALRRAHPAVELVTGGDALETLIHGAGLLVTALGVTVAEAHTLGTPVALLTNYESDAEAADRLSAAGAVADLGHHAAITDEELAAALCSLWTDEARLDVLGKAGRRLIDGRGAARAAALIADLAAGEGGPAC